MIMNLLLICFCIYLSFMIFCVLCGFYFIMTYWLVVNIFVLAKQILFLRKEPTWVYWPHVKFLICWIRFQWHTKTLLFNPRLNTETEIDIIMLTIKSLLYWQEDLILSMIKTYMHLIVYCFHCLLLPHIYFTLPSYRPHHGILITYYKLHLSHWIKTGVQCACWITV